MTRFVGALEAGGTKFVAAIFRLPDQDSSLEATTTKETDVESPFLSPPVRSARVPTTSPEETLEATVKFFQNCAESGLGIEALGIGSFGPIDPDPTSDSWGYIRSTPKPGWSNTNIAGILGRRLNTAVGFDTDVNAAALAEASIGSGKGLDPVLYLTVGTGIGGGAWVNGGLLHGLTHPEMGHIRISRHYNDDFAGCCPFHADCLEGMASGPAVEKRWGCRGEQLEPEHPAWDLEAWYLAQGLVSLTLALSPQAIVLGGGVMAVPGLMDKVRAYAAEHCAHYLTRPADIQDWTRLIRHPLLPNPGLAGAGLLAIRALERRQQG